MDLGGELDAGGAEDPEGERLLGAGVEERDDEVVDRQGEADSSAGGEDAGEDQREGDLGRTCARAVAPRSIAASSRFQSKPRMRAFTVSATKRGQNRMWAMTIVVKPRSPPQPMNRVASDEPITISGVVIGSTSSRLISAPPLNR